MKLSAGTFHKPVTNPGPLMVVTTNGPQTEDRGKIIRTKQLNAITVASALSMNETDKIWNRKKVKIREEWGPLRKSSHWLVTTTTPKSCSVLIFRPAQTLPATRKINVARGESQTDSILAHSLIKLLTLFLSHSPPYTAL